MESEAPFWCFVVILIFNCTPVFSIEPCQETIEHGELVDGIVECNTGFRKTECEPTENQVEVNDASICELDVVSLAIAVTLMVVLLVIATFLFTIIIKRYRKNRGPSHGAMYADSNEYVIHQPRAPGDDSERDGYRRKEKENGDRIIEISIEDAAATSNDFKYHEHKDEIDRENSEFVSSSHDNRGMLIDNEMGGVGGACGIDVGEHTNQGMVEIHEHDDEEGNRRKSGKSKNKQSKKKSKVKKSADKSKQKSSTKNKKEQPETRKEQPEAMKEQPEAEKDKIAVEESIEMSDLPKAVPVSPPGNDLYQSMEELNEEVLKDKDTDAKLTIDDKDVVENRDLKEDNDAVYAQVDKKYIAMKKLKRQQQTSVNNGNVFNASAKGYNNLSSTGSHTTISDEGYGEEIEAV